MHGIYTNATGTLSKVISDGDELGGKTITSLLIAPQSLIGEVLVFGVVFSDGSSGIFEAKLAPIIFGGFLPPLSKKSSFEQGQTIPIKFQLFDTNGQQITSLAAVQSLQIQALDKNGHAVGAPFTPVSANGKGLVYHHGNDSDDGEDDGHFTFKWKTKGLKAGAYQIVLTLADGTVHTLTVNLKR
jgi:hypothetical protein